jgi:transcriptional regulator with XRE-family HTH domain
LYVLLPPWEHVVKSLRTRSHRALISALRAARDDAGLTQEQVAARLKRPQSFVAKYEAGERRIDVVEFLQIAEALRADPCAILRRVR